MQMQPDFVNTEHLLVDTDSTYGNEDLPPT
jgi:hypothetical protein